MQHISGENHIKCIAIVLKLLRGHLTEINMDAFFARPAAGDAPSLPSLIAPCPAATRDQDRFPNNPELQQDDVNQPTMIPPSAMRVLQNLICDGASDFLDQRSPLAVTGYFPDLAFCKLIR